MTLQIRRRTIQLLLATVLPLILYGQANAISIDKTALEIDLAAVVKNGVAFITVSNEKDTPVFVSSALKAWKVQQDGKFDLSEAVDAKVTPSVVNLAGKASATFQVRYMGAANLNKQIAYRLILKESPRLNIEDLKEGLGTQLMLTATMSMPVIVTPKAKLSDSFENVSMQWRLAGNAESGKPRIRLELGNNGQRYVMAQELKIGSKSAKALNQYLLPGDKVSLDVELESTVAEMTRFEMMLRYLGETKTIEVPHE